MLIKWHIVLIFCFLNTKDKMSQWFPSPKTLFVKNSPQNPLCNSPLKTLFEVCDCHSIDRCSIKLPENYSRSSSAVREENPTGDNNEGDINTTTPPRAVDGQDHRRLWRGLFRQLQHSWYSWMNVVAVCVIAFVCALKHLYFFNLIQAKIHFWFILLIWLLFNELCTFFFLFFFLK